jgi:hypothetical protein
MASIAQGVCKRYRLLSDTLSVQCIHSAVIRQRQSLHEFYFTVADIQ